MFDWSTHAHKYQKKGAAHLWNSTATLGAAALWLSPGYGKTMIALHAFKALLDAGLATNMLVVAPLRVIQTVWAQEIDDWSSLKGLVAARLHGPKKEKWLKRRDVNVWLINYEGLPWLSDLAKRGKMPFGFDVIVFDEVRRMKNAQSKRFKAVRPLAALAKYRWGLTGTPASNGLMDLFGQFLIIDGGKTLGDRITKFRYEYFEKHYDGFTWLPRPGAQEAIEAKIEPYVFRADGHLDLPDFVYDYRSITLDTKSRSTYNAMKRDLLTDVEGETITAANAAVLMGKLKQMANGRVYDENRNVLEIHTAKRDALAELVEELGDEQLLIAYEYNHDLTQIREVLGDDIPYLGSGVNETTMRENVDRWNRREIQILAAHPASAGHGLNLQKGGAHHILWWGPTFDLDHYIQFNDRLRRQGNSADAVVVHTFVTEQSVDETAVKAREEKDTLQSALLKALTAEFGESITVDTETLEETTMTQLQFKSDSDQGQQQAPANPFAQPAQAAQAGAPANPFAQPAQGQPQQAAPAGNPFAQPAQGQATQQAQANPFAQPAQGQPQQAAPAGNPFAGGAQAQQQAIVQDVAAQPVQAEQQNPFAQTGQTGQVEDAVVTQETPPANPFAQTGQPGQNPFEGSGQAPVGDGQPNDSGWVDTTGKAVSGAPAPLQDAMETMTNNGADGLVPFFTMLPADKLDKVMAAIGRAIK